MKIQFDTVSKEYRYPLSQKDIKEVKKNIDSAIINKIKLLRFGCNTKTTQEGRTVKRGNSYDIRINFCLNQMKSYVLSENKEYIDVIKKFGGKINFATRTIEWSLLDSKRYALFILLHEIGHIVYCESYLGGKLSTKTSLKEENWCDNYAQKKLT